MPRCLDDPGTRKFRYPRLSPLIDRSGKRFLRHLFRKVEVTTEEPNQRSDNPAPFVLIDLFNNGVRVQEHTQG
jgi:hypothetical protein